MPHYDVHQLTGSDGRATIALEGQVYTLRITRANKLILTK
nr:hemin uptake protein HemP [Pacificitalea manganoxidans]